MSIHQCRKVTDITALCYLRNVLSLFHVKAFLGLLQLDGSMIKDESRKEVGRIGEDIASEFLQRKGFRIIARNYRKPWG